MVAVATVESSLALDMDICCSYLSSPQLECSLVMVAVATVESSLALDMDICCSYLSSPQLESCLALDMDIFSHLSSPQVE
jgi:hypothetical protein